jgi:hypothetical protein
VHHWIGAMFIPKATVADFKAAVQDYDNFKTYYKPEVTESKQIAHAGDEDDVFLRLSEKLLRAVVLNTNYHVRYAVLDPQRAYVISRSSRIAEWKDPKNPASGEEPIGNDSGIVWRFNWYWRFEQADGGIYAEWEMISLSRDLPFGVRWIFKGFAERLPKASVMNTLRGTKAAVARQMAGRN